MSDEFYLNIPHNHGGQTQKAVAMLPKDEELYCISELMRQLCDLSRMKIFWLLCHCEECVINIAAIMKMSSPAVSHHLRQLKESGLIVSRREGKEVYYKAAQSEKTELLHLTIERLLEMRCPTDSTNSKKEGGV